VRDLRSHRPSARRRERRRSSGKHRKLDTALDDQIETGHGADLRLYRLTQRVPVEKPGRRDQADQRRAEKRGNGIPRRFIPWVIVKTCPGRVDVGLMSSGRRWKRAGCGPTNWGLPEFGKYHSQAGNFRPGWAPCQPAQLEGFFLDAFKAHPASRNPSQKSHD